MDSSTLALIAAAMITAVLIGLLRLRDRSADDKTDRIAIRAEHVVDLVSTHDAEGNFRYVSPGFAAMLGATASSLKGRNPREFAHPDDARLVDGIWPRAAVWAVSPAVINWRCRRQNNDYAWLETTARVMP